MTELTIQRYSDLSYIIRGETKKHKEKIKEIGSVYVNNPKDEKGPGWIVSTKNYEKAMHILSGLVKEISEGENYHKSIPVKKDSKIKVTSLESVLVPLKYEKEGIEYQILFSTFAVPKKHASIVSDSGNTYHVQDVSNIEEGFVSIEDSQEKHYKAYYIPSLKKWLVVLEEGMELFSF